MGGAAPSWSWPTVAALSTRSEETSTLGTAEASEGQTAPRQGGTERTHNMYRGFIGAHTYQSLGNLQIFEISAARIYFCTVQGSDDIPGTSPKLSCECAHVTCRRTAGQSCSRQRGRQALLVGSYRYPGAPHDSGATQDLPGQA